MAWTWLWPSLRWCQVTLVLCSGGVRAEVPEERRAFRLRFRRRGGGGSGRGKKIARGSSPWVVASGPALRAAEGGAVPENEPFLLNSGRGLPFGIFQRAAFWQPGAPEIKFFPAKFQR